MSFLRLFLNSQKITALPISGKKSTVTGFKTFQSMRGHCKHVCWGGLSILQLHNLNKHPGTQLLGPSGLGWSCTRQVFFLELDPKCPLTSPPRHVALNCHKMGKGSLSGGFHQKKLLSHRSVKSDTEAQTQDKKKILICSYADATLVCKLVPILNSALILLSLLFSPAGWGELAAWVKVLCLVPIHQKIKP